MRAGLRSFAGVAHRLEEIARHEGVLYVNDSKATNVASTLVALEAFATRSRDAPRLSTGDRSPDPRRPGQGSGLQRPARAGRRALRAVYLIGEDAPLIAAALAGVADL